MTRWYSYSRWLAILMAAMLVGDAILLPGLVRRQKLREAAEQAKAAPEIVAPDVPQIGTHEDPTLRIHTRFTDAIEWVNIRAGEYRGLLGRDIGVRLLLRGHRALRVQLTDQLAA